MSIPILWTTTSRWPPESPTLVSGGRMGRKSAMAFPTSTTGASPHGSVPFPSPGNRRTPSIHAAPAAAGLLSLRSSESDHQLEKLEFALAVAIGRGDGPRIQALRDQIAALGGNSEEPGT
jgi:hypothetical protein